LQLALLAILKAIGPTLPDERTGNNSIYEIYDALIAAFSVFYLQSPSFLSWQTIMEESQGKNNAKTIFGIDKIPSDNQIRNLLDPIDPKFLYPVFNTIFDSIITREEIQQKYRCLPQGYLIALDGVWFHSSNTIHCEQCSSKTAKDGTITWYHNVITPVMVSPDHDKVINLVPEYIVPQDGHEKQDCENTAAKRWLTGPGLHYVPLGITILGDDLYCNQPLCSLMQEYGYNYLLTCKDSSHKYLSEWISFADPKLDLHEFTTKVKKGKSVVTHRYRYATQVPLNGSEHALLVNYLELCILNDQGLVTSKFAYVTNLQVDRSNIDHLIRCGRSRWKIENEHNNTLKTKGYNLEHNFGHGKRNLSNLLLTINLLAFLMHTVLAMYDEKVALLRKTLPTRKTFYNDIRAMTTYLCFTSWDQMIAFMLHGLKNKHIINVPDG